MDAIYNNGLDPKLATYALCIMDDIVACLDIRKISQGGTGTANFFLLPPLFAGTEDIGFR